MLSMQEIPNTLKMSPSLRELSQWLHSNKEFAPDATMPFNLSDVEKADHRHECKVYNSKIEEFNEMLAQEVKASEQSNSEIVTKMRIRDAELNQFRDALVKIVDVEHSRIVSLLDEEMLSHSMFTEWSNQLKQRLYTQVVGI